MADVTEIEALKASLRGARAAAEALSARSREGSSARDPHADVADADLDDLQRLTLANAIAAQALRGLVETMLKRRGSWRHGRERDRPARASTSRSSAGAADRREHVGRAYRDDQPERQREAATRRIGLDAKTKAGSAGARVIRLAACRRRGR